MPHNQVEHASSRILSHSLLKQNEKKVLRADPHLARPTDGPAIGRSTARKQRTAALSATLEILARPCISP